MYKNRSGFTLVELAIVIVIIGLLVTGVLQGRELIDQAKLRSNMKSLGEYEVAATVFKDQFQCIPGDCLRASTLIETAAINGNGDGKIGHTFTSGPYINMESLAAWQHLTLANLLKGSYTGVGNNATAGDMANLGVNIPKAFGYDAGYWFFYRSSTQSMAGGFSNFGKTNSHIFVIGSYPQTTMRLYDGFLTPALAQQFDEKLDDGLPQSGSINIGNGNTTSTGCTLPTAQSAWSGSLPTGFDFSSEKANCIVFKWLDL